MENLLNCDKILFIARTAIDLDSSQFDSPYKWDTQLDAYASNGWGIVVISNEKEAQEPSAKFDACVENIKNLMAKYSDICQCIFCTEPHATRGETAYALGSEDRRPQLLKLPNGVSGMRMPYPGMLLCVLKVTNVSSEHTLFVGTNGQEKAVAERAEVPYELVTKWINKVPPGLE